MFIHSQFTRREWEKSVKKVSDKIYADKSYNYWYLFQTDSDAGKLVFVQQKVCKKEKSGGVITAAETTKGKPVCI